MVNDESFEDFCLINSYTRKQAIDDRVLVDLMQGEWGELVRQSGFNYPIAMTATAFSKFVELTPKAEQAGNDIKGRLSDVLTMFRHAMRQNFDDRQILFDFICVVDQIRPTRHTLKGVVGLDDDGKPCITLMLPDED